MSHIHKLHRCESCWGEGFIEIGSSDDSSKFICTECGGTGLIVEEEEQHA